MLVNLKILQQLINRYTFFLALKQFINLLTDSFLFQVQENYYINLLNNKKKRRFCTIQQKQQSAL